MDRNAQITEELTTLIEEGEQLMVLISDTDQHSKFIRSYQCWYTKGKILVQRLAPQRFDDFVGHYSSKSGNEGMLKFIGTPADKYGLFFEENCLAAVRHLDHQVAIMASLKSLLASSLRDVKQTLQADLFDNELDAATDLAKKGFLRSAGVLAGVVLERHLAQVCDSHGIDFKKKNLTTNDYIDQLKSLDVITLPTFRHIQYLADIRNKCCHLKESEPTKDELDELIAGVNNIIKNVF